MAQNHRTGPMLKLKSTEFRNVDPLRTRTDICYEHAPTAYGPWFRAGPLA
jgi:hypothetical protein